MRANHKTGRQSEGKMSGIWEKIKERLGFGRKAEGDKEDDRVMYIIAGLGNPTREYEKTRHNVGFEVIDVLADRLGTTVEEKKFKGLEEFLFHIFDQEKEQAYRRPRYYRSYWHEVYLEEYHNAVNTLPFKLARKLGAWKSRY